MYREIIKEYMKRNEYSMRNKYKNKIKNILAKGAIKRGRLDNKTNWPPCIQR